MLNKIALPQNIWIVNIPASFTLKLTNTLYKACIFEKFL